MIFRSIAGSVALCILLLGTADVSGQELGGLALDQTATDAIHAATTEERFLTPWVESLPEHPDVPSPRDVLGYTIGTPGELTQVEEIYGYYDALAAASPNVAIFSMGQTQEGREMRIVAIADAETIEDIEVYKGYLRDLADPRVTGRVAAEAIIEKAKPIYWLTGGLHSPELGPPEMLMELAYRLAVEERNPFTEIRAGVITMITPVVEVDGRARQVDWYRRHVKGYTDYYERPRSSVPFWGHYTYHDNNRDGIMISQAMMRNYVDTFFDWMPTLSLDLHESVPFLYVATGTGPYNKRVSPITVAEWASIANYEINRATGFGLDGVWTWGYYTGWYPGYMLWVTNNHNSSGRFYETFGNGSAETMKRDLKGATISGEDVTTQQWYRFVPPDRKVTWSMRNNTNYMQTGVIASLEMAAKNSDLFLSNFYQKGVNALKASTEEAPYAYVVSADQRDVGTARTLIETLSRHGVEMELSAENKSYGDVTVERGDVIIKLNQPYGPLARNLLEKQTFPDDVEVPPYDDVGWTLGLVLGVEVAAIDEVSVLDHGTAELPGGIFNVSSVPARSPFIGIPNHGQRNLGPLRFALADVPMAALDEEVEVRAGILPRGSLIIEVEVGNRDRIRAAIDAAGLKSIALSRAPTAVIHDVDLPRIALWHSWTDTQNAGWVRYTLDEADVPYAHIMKERVQEGGLRDDFDVLIVPAFRGSAQLSAVLAGVDGEFGALDYRTTEDTPNLGKMVSSDDITGGLGLAGLQEIRNFVETGGTLITFGAGGVIATDAGMMRRVATQRPAGLNTPGSVLTAKVTGPENPLVYGYDEVTHIFRTNGPLFRVADRNRHIVALQFGTKHYDEDENADNGADKDDDEDKSKPVPLVQSGGIIGGAEAIDGSPALLYDTLGDGRIVIFAWNPMHRHENQHDHAFVYNAILHWNDLPDPDVWRQAAEEAEDG